MIQSGFLDLHLYDTDTPERNKGLTAPTTRVGQKARDVENRGSFGMKGDIISFREEGGLIIDDSGHRIESGFWVHDVEIKRGMDVVEGDEESSSEYKFYKLWYCIR